MDKLKSVGLIIFLILVGVGFVGFKEYKKKADLQAETDAVTYFSSLMTQDQSQLVNDPNGGPQLHPWSLTATPTQTEIEDKVSIPKTMENDSFVWKVHYDPTGGTNPKVINVRAVFDAQGKLSSLSGMHGTVTTFSGGWLPD